MHAELKRVKTFEEGRIRLKKAKKATSVPVPIPVPEDRAATADQPEPKDTSSSSRPPSPAPPTTGSDIIRPHPLTGSTAESMKGFRPQKLEEFAGKAKKGPPKGSHLNRGTSSSPEHCKKSQKEFYKDFYNCETPTDQDLARIKANELPDDPSKWSKMDVWARAKMLPATGIQVVEGIVALQADFYRRKAGFQKALRFRDDHRRSHFLEVRRFVMSIGFHRVTSLSFILVLLPAASCYHRSRNRWFHS